MLNFFRILELILQIINRIKNNMETLKVVLLAVVLMGLVMAGLALQILVKKGGKFPNTHIGGNRHMKARGITCAQTDDKMEQAKARKEFRFKQLSFDKSEDKSFC